MSLRTWWHDTTLLSKTIVILCALLILEIGLCFSTPYTVQPAVEVFSRPADRLGLVILQALLCVITFLLLVLLLIARFVASLSHPASQPSVVPHNSDSDSPSKR